MKKLIAVAAIAASTTLAGCAMAPFQPGALFTQQKIPVDAPNNATSCAKHGSGSATNILGLFAIGDASVGNAKKMAGISKIDTVDVTHTGILGLFSTTTTEVCGD